MGDDQGSRSGLPPPPPPPPASSRPRRSDRSRWLFLAVGLLVGAIAGAGIGVPLQRAHDEDVLGAGPAAATSAAPVPTASAVSTSTSPTSVPSPTPAPTSETSSAPPVAVPSPDGSYSSQCDYVLGDFSDNTSHGFRLIAGTSIRNTGNVGIKVDVVAHWLRLGAGPIKEAKQAQVPYRGSKRVSFTIPTDRDTIDLIQGAQDDPNFCGVKVTITGTFGEAH